MAQVPEGDLVARILALESSVRSLQAAAAVGGTSVAASDPASVTLTGVASTAGGVDWNYAGPTVELFVSGGRLRVDVAAAFDVYGNKCSLYVGYRVMGGVESQDLLDGSPVVVAAAYEKSAQLQDDGVGMNQFGAFSTFDLVEGLEVGWYRVTQAYALAYSGTTGSPFGTASNRRLSVTRY